MRASATMPATISSPEWAWPARLTATPCTWSAMPPPPEFWMLKVCDELEGRSRPLWVRWVSACPWAAPSSTRSAPAVSLRAARAAPSAEWVTPKTPKTAPEVSGISPRIAATPVVRGASGVDVAGRSRTRRSPVAAVAAGRSAAIASASTRQRSSTARAAATSSAHGAPARGSGAARTTRRARRRRRRRAPARRSPDRARGRPPARRRPGERSALDAPAVDEHRALGVGDVEHRELVGDGAVDAAPGEGGTGAGHLDEAVGRAGRDGEHAGEARASRARERRRARRRTRRRRRSDDMSDPPESGACSGSSARTHDAVVSGRGAPGRGARAGPRNANVKLGSR